MRQDGDAKQGALLPWQQRESLAGLREGSTRSSISIQAAPGKCKHPGQGTSSEIKLGQMT